MSDFFWLMLFVAGVLVTVAGCCWFVLSVFSGELFEKCTKCDSRLTYTRERSTTTLAMELKGLDGWEQRKRCFRCKHIELSSGVTESCC